MSRGHTASKQKPAAARSGPSKPSGKACSGSLLGKSVRSSLLRCGRRRPRRGLLSIRRIRRRVWRPKVPTATKAKVKDKAVPEKEKEAAAPETPDSPLPLLDLSDAAVKKMIKQAKKRGYVTHEQLNAVLPSEEVSSDQIEDIYAMLNEMGINVVEQEEGADDEEAKPADAEEDDDDSDGELVEAKPKALATVEKKEPSERTDDPVRMYLREMGSVELLVPRGRNRDRQAHRGRPRGDDRRPLRKPADVPGHHHLARRTEHRKGVPARHHRSRSDLRRPRRQEQHGDAERPAASAPTASRFPGARQRPAARQTASQAALASDRGAAAAGRRAAVGAAVGDPVQARRADGEARPKAASSRPADGDFDDDDMENSLSLAAIEAELKPKVVETFDKIADTFKRLRRLQDQDIQLQLKSDALSPAQERKYKKLKDEIIAEVKSLRLNQARIDALVEQLYDINKRLVGYEGRLMRLSESYGVVARGLPEELPGLRARPALAQPRLEALGQGLEEPRRQGQGQGQGNPRQHPPARRRDRPRDRRIPQDRALRAEGRARGAPGQEGDGGGEPPPRHLDRQEIHQPRPAVPRPDPGRQHRPDEGGRQVRVPPRLQVLDLRDVVDPPGDHPLDRRPGAHHPHPGAHDRDDQQDRAHQPPDAERDRPRADARGARREARHAARRRCARSSRSPRSRCRSRRRSATRRIHTSATSSRTRTRSCRSTRRSSRNLRETTTRVLASLTPREERVLRMRFGIGMNTDHTLEEVGQQFSVTRERIRQIEAKALRKLKHPIAVAEAPLVPRQLTSAGEARTSPRSSPRKRRPRGHEHQPHHVIAGLVPAILIRGQRLAILDASHDAER